MTTTSRAPLYIILSIAGITALFGLGYVALAAGPWTMVALVFALLAVGGIALFFFKGFTDTALSIYDKKMKAQAEKNQHERSMLELELKYNRRQIEAPVGAPVVTSQANEYINLARELAGVTVDVLGPQSTQLLPFNRAQRDHLSPFDDVNMWQNAMKFLTQNGYAAEKKKGDKSEGVFTINGYTAQNVYDRLMNR